jgi:F-type H+-transporting ATPase subunit delta
MGMTMVSDIFVKRYAKAVFNIALKRKEFRKWQSDLRVLACLARDNALSGLLRDPEVDYDEKARVLSERSPLLDPLAIRVMCVLARQGQLDTIGDIAEAYRRLVDHYLGMEAVEDAEVITAIPLDDENRLMLTQRITDIFGKPIVLKSKVDPSIIGGIIIKVGDELIDGSVRGKLEALKKEVTSG